jgi:hypothetical protein
MPWLGAIHLFRSSFMKITFDTVRKMGLRLPDVEESTTFGTPALKVHGQLLACPAINKSAEPGSIVVRIAIDQRDELIAGDPDAYYLTDHYRPYPYVLVRLTQISPDALQDLLLMSWKFVTEKKTKKGKKR